ncbi:hypothetical protein FN846DRAFT_886176 [Sphaerosporella brunnea]|uniref:Uncharacterized protein n=1 Tax=Sphaerosporella brunnea TaxID=1250544 RepID=A0A5J5F9I6_9PEZI|nr:hypothetical protein FN846DRAFT_886176 [Sphaerosporella brunnea]
MSPISNLSPELYLQIIVSLLDDHEYDIRYALSHNLLPFLRASPDAFRVWRENKAAILNRAAVQHLVRLKPYALAIRRMNLRSLLRWYVRLGTYKLAPRFQDLLQEVEHAFNLDERLVAAAVESLAAEGKLKVVRHLVADLKTWLAEGYHPVEISWTRKWFQSMLLLTVDG